MSHGIRRRLTSRADADRPQELLERMDRLEQRVEQLADRLDELAEGLQEQRHLNPRIAFLSDYVAEVVSATVRGDRDALDAALAKYSDGI